MAIECRKGNTMTTKMNNVHKYAILWLNSQSLSIEDIAQELKLTIKQIQYVLKNQTQNDTDTNKNISNASEPVKSKMQDLIITDSASQKHRVAIMTKAGSEMADASRKSNTVDSNNKSYIFRPSK